MARKRLVITDRKYKKWTDRCDHEINWKTGKTCNVLLNEDTGQCPKGHGRLSHLCKTECCGVLVGGNHLYCEGHRKKKVKTICKVQEKIMRRYRKLMWGKNASPSGLDLPEDRKKFNEWKQKLLEKTYDPDFVKKQKELVEVE